MVTTREVSVDAATVTQMVGALLAELGGWEVQAAPDTHLAAELLVMKERVCGLLSFTGDRPVGVIMMSESAAFFARGSYATITELYVVPDQRSSGVAMRLIEAAVELGMVKGWTQLELAAPRQPMWSRNPGLALYVKAGFAEIGPRLQLPLPCLASSRLQAKRKKRLRSRRRQRAATSSIPNSVAAGLALEFTGKSVAGFRPRPPRQR